MFTSIISTYNGSDDIVVSNNEIPVAPPSIKLFGSKKLSNPNAAVKIPRTIKKASLSNDLLVKLVLVFNVIWFNSEFTNSVG